MHSFKKLLFLHQVEKVKKIACWQKPEPLMNEK